MERILFRLRLRVCSSRGMVFSRVRRGDLPHHRHYHNQFVPIEHHMVSRNESTHEDIPCKDSKHVPSPSDHTNHQDQH